MKYTAHEICQLRRLTEEVGNDERRLTAHGSAYRMLSPAEVEARLLTYMSNETTVDELAAEHQRLRTEWLEMWDGIKVR